MDDILDHQLRAGYCLGKPTLRLVHDASLDIPPPPADAFTFAVRPALRSVDRNREMQIAHAIVNVASIGVMALVTATVLYFLFRGAL